LQLNNILLFQLLSSIFYTKDSLCGKILTTFDRRNLYQKYDFEFLFLILLKANRREI